MKKLTITKKAFICTILLLFIIVVGTCVFTSSKNKSDVIMLSLADFKTSTGEYQYDGILWNESLPDVIKNLNFNIESAEIGSTVLDEVDITFFTSVDVIFELGDQHATSTLEFHDNVIEIIKFDFHLDDDYQEWFDTQVLLLKEMNGEASETINNSNEFYTTTGYKWIYEDTVLQIILLTGSDINPSATIGVAKY